MEESCCKTVVARRAAREHGTRRAHRPRVRHRHVLDPAVGGAQRADRRRVEPLAAPDDGQHGPGERGRQQARLRPAALARGLAEDRAGAERVAGGDRRHAALRDGRVVRLDVAGGEVTAEARLGAVAAGLAASSDGRYLAVAMARPPALVVLDRDLARRRELPARDAEGRRESAVTAVRDDARRRSFVAALPGLPELWEVSYDDAAAPIHPGLVHDFRLGEAIAVPGTLNARRAPLDAPVDDVAVDPFGADVVAARRGDLRWQVVNLHVRRRIAWLDAGAAAGAGGVNGLARWRQGERRLAAWAAGGELRVVDAATWSDAARVALGGGGRLVRAHEAAPHAWVVVDADAARIVLVDRASLRVAGEIRLDAGAPVVDVAFGRDGRDALVLLGGPDGALLRYDAHSLAPRGRVALADPVALLPR